MRSKVAIVYLLLMLSTSPAYAHGEQVLFVPVCQLSALVAMILLTTRAFRTLAPFRRWLSVVLAALICVPIWHVPGNYFPEILRYSGWGNFVIGLFPPLLVGGVAICAMWYTKPASKSGKDEL